MTYTSEAEFEEALIHELSKKGWEKEVFKYPTEEDLLKNWANILFDNNRDIDRLNDTPLTDGEMQQIYRLIKDVNPELKITALFDPNIDNGGSIKFKEDSLVEILEDYNKQYEFFSEFCVGSATCDSCRYT